MKPSYRSSLEPYPSSELILRPDGAVYHLGVRGEDLADDILIVGDPERVELISARFDQVDVRKNSREFCIHTGSLNGKRLTVVSTGIGVDNIDIVVNELDAAVNIDPELRTDRSTLRSLRLLRLGTSGSLQESIGVGSIVGSVYAIGMDGVPYHYQAEFEPQEEALADSFRKSTQWPASLSRPYAVSASGELMRIFNGDFIPGITLTANGFYGPQGRSLRVKLAQADPKPAYSSFEFNGLRMSNFEMECAGLYAMASMLGHQAFTLCVILADRRGGKFHSAPSSAIDGLISLALDRLTS